LIPIANPRFSSYSGEFIEHTASLPIGQTVRAVAGNLVGKEGKSLRPAQILLTTPRSEERGPPHRRAIAGGLIFNNLQVSA